MPPTGGSLNRIQLPPPFPAPFHFLEVTVVSAQDLFPALKSSMRTYVILWTNPAHKLRTSIDTSNHINPVWNDKLGFHLDDETLKSDTASINFDIYAVRSKLRPGSDTLLGTARALISTLRLTLTVKFVALQIRRPNSLRPQGILNVGIALVDMYGKSMPLNISTGAAAKKSAAEKSKLVKTKSVREMEKKLEKWKVELPSVKDKGEGEKDRIKIGRGKSRRTNGRIPWTVRDGEGREGGEKLER